MEKDRSYNIPKSSLVIIFVLSHVFLALLIILFIPFSKAQVWILFGVMIGLIVSQGYVFNQWHRKLSQQWRKLVRDTRDQEQGLRYMICRDIELTRLNDKFRSQDREKSELMSIAAHQLRTPLSGIKWGLDLLLDEAQDNLTDDQRDLVRKSYESNERLISLVNNLLNADRLESGRTELKPTLVQLKDIIDNILYYILPRAEQKKIEVELSIEESLPEVYVDNQKIREAFQNLLDNAIKYTGKQGKIVLSMYRQKEAVMVSLSDTGIGIPERESHKVFNKFFRSENATRSQSPGTGLGLFVAKEIIIKHGGEIWFESEENKGTTFFVRLPTKKPNDKTVPKEK